MRNFSKWFSSWFLIFHKIWWIFNHNFWFVLWLHSNWSCQNVALEFFESLYDLLENYNRENPSYSFRTNGIFFSEKYFIEFHAWIFLWFYWLSLSELFEYQGWCRNLWENCWGKFVIHVWHYELEFQEFLKVSKNGGINWWTIPLTITMA